MCIEKSNFRLLAFACLLVSFHCCCLLTFAVYFLLLGFLRRLRIRSKWKRREKNNSREMENETAFDLLFHSFARPAGRTLGLLVGQSVIQSVDCHCETCSDHGRVASTWTTLSRSLFQVLPQIHPSPSSTSSSSVFCFFFSLFALDFYFFCSCL